MPSSNQPDLVLLNLVPGGVPLTHDESIITEVDLYTQYGGRSSPALPQNMIETLALVRFITGSG